MQRLWLSWINITDSRSHAPRVTPKPAWVLAWSDGYCWKRTAAEKDHVKEYLSQTILRDTRRFFELFESTLDYCIGSGNIRFEEPLMRDHLNSLVRRLYNVHSNISEPSSLANTSSSSLMGTQLAIPRTPVLENQDPTSLSQRHILDPKLKSYGRRPLHIPEPHTGTAMGLDSQTQFIIPSHIPPNMPYGTPNFNSYGDQLAGVAPTLPATQHPYAYYMNDGWTNLQYPLPQDPEGQNMLYMPHAEPN
ncbi:hypothetical protein M434DRAFT_113809 [Hypoxylon sp. CO27-5]|nr:hypothetical protein M434DRAFT_113809 [Hypoxylon sp. CO27-5]